MRGLREYQSAGKSPIIWEAFIVVVIVVIEESRHPGTDMGSKTKQRVEGAVRGEGPDGGKRDQTGRIETGDLDVSVSRTWLLTLNGNWSRWSLVAEGSAIAHRQERSRGWLTPKNGSGTVR